MAQWFVVKALDFHLANLGSSTAVVCTIIIIIIIIKVLLSTVNNTK